jgi:mRNA interferase RelE/StbE
MFKVSFKKSAQKELYKIPQKEQILILKAIKNLQNDPFPSGAIKLVGEDTAFRIRIGDYRVIYNIFKNELIIEIIRIKHRKDVYR